MEGKPIKTEEEISNVDLQFMGQTDEKRDLKAAITMESLAARDADDPQREGMDKQDIAVAQSMDASDPPSTNMGDTDSDMTDTEATAPDRHNDAGPKTSKP